MRSADASGFQFDPSLLATPRFLALSPADTGGLLRLWAAAWACDCRVPSDARTLAALSGLGDSWGPSMLAQSLPLFFRADGAHLVALDLEDQAEKRKRIRGKRRMAGKASADARRTHVEHVLNTCSTHVEHVLPAGEKGGPAAPPRKPRKSRAKVQLAHPVVAAEAAAAGPPDCSEHSPGEPPVYDCPPTPPI